MICKLVFATVGLLSSTFAFSQVPITNIIVTDATVEQVLTGNFNPADYQATNVLNSPDTIIGGLMSELNADSLKNYMIKMSSFGNRNTGADTVSNTFGIGAARRWAHAKFESFSAINESRLLVSYLQFDAEICSVGQHRDIFAVLPGTGPQFDEVVLVEAHFDSRCEDLCDSLCSAHGMEDNGSGSALVLELARVMPKYSYNRTIVFMLTIGEEQGLYGAEGMATWMDDNSVNLNAVFNNDVIGGITCGQTASPPGCPGLNDIDSLNVRLYSLGAFSTLHKSLARFSKLEYQENMKAHVAVPMTINIMSGEDRAGRGGDHMPFRAKGFPAVRFTSANEHGDGNGLGDTAYHDRQHTVDDLLGVDTDNDNVIDSFFVDFNYLMRNAMINGNAISMAAIGPIPPNDFTVEEIFDGIVVDIDDPNNYAVYRVGVRSTTNDWDSVFTFTGTNIDTLWGLTPGINYRVSVCSVDPLGIESLFGYEKFADFVEGMESLNQWNTSYPVKLLQNKPNPFDDATTITVLTKGRFDYKDAFISVADVNGVEKIRIPISLRQEVNEILYDHRYHMYHAGVFAYSLVIDGQIVGAHKMIFAY
jgi:hypothetical protein